MAPAEPDRHAPAGAQRTAVVVPCYDEAHRLPAARFEAFLAAEPAVDLVLVDDGSRDATLARLRALESAWPGRVRVLALPENAGKAEAVRRGMLCALEREVAYAGFWDADLATPLEAVVEFRGVLAARPGLELVMGSRVVLLGRRIERHALRHYLGRLAATTISAVLGLRVYDTQCGAKLFRAGPALSELFAEPFVARWAFDVEILARMIRARRERRLAPADAVICELPLMEWTDVAGSKVRPADYLRAGVDLWRIRRRYLAG